MIEDPKARAEIDLAVRIFAGLLQRHVPGLVSALHLVGSAVLGDFEPGRSDLDFVAVLSRPAADDDIEALVIVHRLYAADPTLAPLDGIWVGEAELAAGPDAAADGLTTKASELLAAARGNRNPVTWFMLSDHSSSVLGALDRSQLWRDPGRLAAWTRENAGTYWTRWLAASANLLSRRGLALLGGAATEWGVLGISRLHHTLGTGRIASKVEAGEHALRTFEPRWHRIVKEALRLRRRERGGLYRHPLLRRREALAFVGAVIAAIRAGQTASE